MSGRHPGAGDDLTGRVAWVCGASGALGRAAAAALAGAGASVVLSARKAETLAEIAAEIARRGRGTANALPLDATIAEAVEAAGRQILQQHGRIDILVNSLAVAAFGPFLELGDAEWSRVIDSKLMAYVRTMRTVLPPMVAAQYGRIVNISGRSGRQPQATHLPGAAMNAAVNILGKGLADQYARENIRINTVAPGPIASPRLDSLIGAAPTDAGTASYRAETPIPRRGSPEDVAEAVLFLVSERSAYTTGTVLAVDGGGTAAL